MYKIAEKFTSINGEGKRCGQLAVFIRFAGCNLDCTYCDTRWARGKESYNEILTKEELYDYIKETGVKNVTLTGGEPLLTEGIEELLRTLGQDSDLNVEIETNGSVSLLQFDSIRGDNTSFTMDYKLGCSGMEQEMDLDNFKYLNKNDVIKFVIGNHKDLDTIKELLSKYPLQANTNVYFSSVFGSIELKDIVDFMVDNIFNDVNLQVQLHKIIWSPDERGV